MKKFYKIICSNCDKGLGTLLLEEENPPHYLPFLLPNDIYVGEPLKSLSIGDDIIFPIYCSDCADMRGKEE